MTRHRHSLLAAALLGATSGMRTMTPEAVMALRGSLALSRPARAALVLAAAGELIADKLPSVPSRTSPPAYLGRIASGAFCGFRTAGPAGAVTAAAVSAASTRVTYEARMALTARAPLPAPVVAMIEDALAIMTANLGVDRARSNSAR